MKLLPAAEGFLGLDEQTSYQQAKTIIIPFGLEQTVTYGTGTAHGPAAILTASQQVELFDEEFWYETYKKMDIATIVPPKIDKNINNALQQLADITEQVLADGKFPLILGGEHALTAGSIRAFTKYYDDLAILHFDAHADLRDGYAGEHYSHAAALRRALDHQSISQLVSCGIRNISAEEIPFLEANQQRINIHWAKDKRNWDIDKIIAPLKGKKTYLTFDVDGFDSSLMPATGTAEPGGLFWDETLDIIRAASKICDIVGADIVELAPINNLHACDFLAAKLCYKILNYKYFSHD